MRILYLPNAYSQQRQREKKRKIYPVLMAMEAEWYRKQGHEVEWKIPYEHKICKCDNDMLTFFHPVYVDTKSGECFNCGRTVNYAFDLQLWTPKKIREEEIWREKQYFKKQYDKIITEPEGLPFLSLPYPDREFTRWWEYQDNGNFKYRPGTYIQAANGCHWGKCSFCVENGKPYEVRPVEDVIEEIKECKAMGFKEVFDDSGTFPKGRWLDLFCKSVHNVGCYIGCNVRLCDMDYNQMKWAGFRMLLFGLESANQRTLDKINKGVKVEDYKYIIKAAKCGLEPHVAVMFGYPWETDREAVNTLRLVHYLLRKGYAKTAQASFYQSRGCASQSSHRTYVKKIYDVWKYPDFWFNKIRDIKNVDDLKYLWRCIKAGLNG